MVVREMSQRESECEIQYMVMREMSQREDECEIEVHGCKRKVKRGYKL